MGQPRLIFINRYFFPDQSATSQILSDLCFSLARSGRSVTVITSGQLYEDPRAALPRRETVEGVDIRRVGTSSFGRRSIGGRLVDYLSFHLSAAFALLSIGRAGSVAVVLTDPPLLSVTTGVVAALRRVTLINWLQDLYPEVASQADVGIGGGILRLLRWVRNRSLRAAAMNVAIGDTMAKRLGSEAVPAAQISTISNWSNDAAIVPLSGPNPLREEWGLQNKIVIGHSGNLGTAHDAETLLGAAETLRDRNDIVFLIVGGGSRLETLRQEVARRNLTSFLFKPYQPRERLPLSLSLPDVHWLSLRREFEGLIVPSKFYGIAAAGRPMILIGDDEGELGAIIRRTDCGLVVAPNDHERLANAIRQLADEPARRAEMGGNARRALDTDYSMQRSIGKWNDLLLKFDIGQRRD